MLIDWFISQTNSKVQDKRQHVQMGNGEDGRLRKIRLDIGKHEFGKLTKKTIEGQQRNNEALTHDYANRYRQIEVDRPALSPRRTTSGAGHGAVLLD